jgi:hypothetical protein
MIGTGEKSLPIDESLFIRLKEEKTWQKVTCIIAVLLSI